jgi:hypothetical protein
MEEGAEAIARKVVDMAKEGDISAARLVIERLVPVAKERPIFLALPATGSAEGVAQAQAAILQAVAAGDLLPGEAATLAGIVEARRKAVETQALEARVKVAQRLTNPLARLWERGGGEMGNSRSMLRAQRTIPACKPECALQGRWGIHGACSVPNERFRRASRNAPCKGGNGHGFHHRGCLESP